MEIGDILSDAFVYPINNIKSLILYMILGIILGVALAGTAAAVMAGALAQNMFAVVGSGIIGIIIALFLALIISGYELDLIKYGIDKRSGAPDIDFIGQFFNGVKLFVVNIVYYIIPIIIGAILAVIFQHWLSGILTFIVYVIFAFAAIMGQCRLAKTGDLVHALSIGDAIGDISRVGISNFVLLVIVIAVISFILALIFGAIQQWNATVGGIFMGIFGVYLTFFISRSIGLLYSNA